MELKNTKRENSKELEGGITEVYGPQNTEFNQEVICTSEQNDHLYQQMVGECVELNNEDLVSSHAQNSEHFEDLDFAGETGSMQKRRKFEKLEHSVTQGHHYVTSMKTLQTYMENGEEFLGAPPHLRINNYNLMLNQRKEQYRTEKNSRDFGQCSNVIRQMRLYKEQRANDRQRFMSVPCDKAAILKIRDKKLASPLKDKRIAGDEVPMNADEHNPTDIT